MKKLKKFLILFRFLFIRAGVDWSNERMVKDVLRWKKILKIDGNDKYTLAVLLFDEHAFRNLFIFRNRERGFFKRWVALFYKPMDCLYIDGVDVGGGLFIQHGMASMMAPQKMGENCWINQHVVIGFDDTGLSPIIGDNVMITCGAKVLGPVTLGDNVTVGANALVIKDVPANTTVGGVPAKDLHRG